MVMCILGVMAPESNQEVQAPRAQSLVPGFPSPHELKAPHSPTKKAIPSAGSGPTQGSKRNDRDGGFILFFQGHL